MNNDFGVPYNEAEMNMAPPGANKLIDRQLAESGMEMDFWGAVIGGAISVVGGIVSGNKASKAAKQQAQAQNAAADRQLAYDIEGWEMDIDKIHADRDYAVKEVEAMARNEGRVAAYKDAVSKDRYNYDLMIRNRQQASNEQQFMRSGDIYNKQITLNALTAQAGRQDELRKLQEIHSEAQFNAQDAYVKQIVEEGKARARGVSGRSARKTGMSTYADYGRRMAMIDESLDSAGRNSRAVLQEIARDKASADLAAYAQKMLDPGVLPMPIIPYATPMAEFMYPREIGEYDYGPRPVLGAYRSPSAAASQAWASAIPGIASGIGSGLGAYIDRFQ